MRITLLQYSGQPNKIFKGYNFTEDTIKIVDGELVNSLDYHNPTLRMSLSLFSPSHYNYCIVGELGYETISDVEVRVPRGNCYYIDNYTYLNNDIVDITLSLDILYTYCKFINYNFDVILSRHESLFDMRVEDTQLPIIDNSITNVYEGELGDFLYNEESDVRNGICFISTVSNHYNSSSPSIHEVPTCTTYWCSYHDIKALLSRLNELNIGDFFTTFFSEDRSKMITSVTFFPFQNDSYFAYDENNEVILSRKLPVGMGVISSEGSTVPSFYVNPIGIRKVYINGGRINLFGDRNTNKQNLDFYLRSPYSIYEVYIPFYGWYQIDTQKLHNDTTTLNFIYYINLIDGMSIVQIIEEYYRDNYRTYEPIQTYGYVNCQCGVQIPLGSGDANQIIRNTLSNMVNLGVQVIGHNIENKSYKVRNSYLDSLDYDANKSRLIDDYYLNEKALVNASGNFITNSIKGMQVNSSGTVKGSYEILNMELRPLIKKVIPNVLNYENYNKTVGRPSTYNGTINKLPFSKYGVCSAIYVRNGYPTYSFPKINDLNSIISILKSGFYK